MAEEILNEGYEPVEIEDSTKKLIGIRKKSDGTLLAVTKEQYAGYDKRSYAVDGFIIRNEDEDVNLLCSTTESLATFGEGPADIPETDKRRKNAPTNPTFSSLDGEWCTQWQLQNHPETHESGCAICEAVKFGWLPSNGEMAKIIEYAEDINDLAETCGATGLNGLAYWCSTQYEKDYMWCYDMQMKSFVFWKSKATQMMIRPVKSASDYIEVEE